MASLQDQINAAFRTARLQRDEPTKNVISMLKNKVLTELKAGTGATESDDLWRSVIAAYAKQVRKSIPELQKAGERGAEAVAEARFELEFCERFLPKKLDEAATEALVRQTAKDHGLTSPGDLGRLMGLLMKTHRDALDGALARAVGQRVLAE